jgi:NACalpha-BTF3-like transcription factor
MEKIPRQLYVTPCLPMDVVFPWARAVADRSELPGCVLEPCFHWLLNRGCFCLDAVKIVLATHLSPVSLRFLKKRQRVSDTLAFFGHVTKHASERFPDIHMAVLYSGCLPAPTAVQLLDYLATVLAVGKYRQAAAAFHALYSGMDSSAPECCICTEAVAVPDCFLECRHVFHAACLAQWRHTCPMCRRDIKFLQPTDPFLEQPQVETAPLSPPSQNLPSIEQYAAVVDHFLNSRRHTIFSAYVASFSNDLDVRLVQGQTGATRGEAVRALLENDGDVVSAILDLIS